MKVSSEFANKLESSSFVATAELLPTAGVEQEVIKTMGQTVAGSAVAVNVADNPLGPVTSSLAASCVLLQAGIEPIYQVVSRDRNRLAIQSDILGAAALGIKHVLCLTGYHQSLAGYPESANVYDIDSVQMIAAIQQMNEKQELIKGEKIEGGFAMLIGAVANPYLKPLPLNMMKLTKKVQAGACFIQTQAVFDVAPFEEWLNAAQAEGITDRAAILVGVMPLASAEEAEELRNTFTDFVIPDRIVERLKAAGGPDAQKKEGIAVCAEVIQKLKALDGVKGIHILSGGKEAVVPEVIAAAGLQNQ